MCTHTHSCIQSITGLECIWYPWKKITVYNWDSHGSERIGCQGLQYDPWPSQPKCITWVHLIALGPCFWRHCLRAGSLIGLGCPLSVIVCNRTCWATAVGMGWGRRLEVWTDVLYKKYRSWDRCSETLIFLVIVMALRSEPSVRGGKPRSQLNLKCLY